MSNEFKERWDDLADLLRSVYGKQAGFEENIKEVEVGADRIFRLAQAAKVDQELSLTAHRWWHTFGLPQLNLTILLVGIVAPHLITEATFKIAEDMFHLGFLAGHAEDSGLLTEELVPVDDVSPCLAAGSRGVESPDMILARLSPQNIAELRAVSELMTKLHEAHEEPPAEPTPPADEGYF